MRMSRGCVFVVVGVLHASTGCSSTEGHSYVATQRTESGEDASELAEGDSSLSEVAMQGDAASSEGGEHTPRIPTHLEATSDCAHPEVIRSCSDGWCVIPAGCYIMGAPRDSLAATRVSNVQVQVSLSHRFLMGETEVTRSDWFALGLPEPRPDWTKVWGTDDPQAIAPDNALCLEADCPVNWVGFEDAAAYANLLSEAEGFKPCYLLADCVRSPGNGMRCLSVRVDAASPYECEGYRLPTDAEWEYAARAGTETDVYSGNLDSTIDSDSFDCQLDTNLDRVGWYCANSGHPSHRVGTGRPHRVAQKEANGFGLYDVSGNLLEWVNDRMTPGGYGVGPLVDPVNGVDDPSNLTPNTPVYSGENDALDADGFPDHRTQRGGSYDFFSRLAASATRIASNAGSHRSGFRLVRTLIANSEGAGVPADRE